MDQHSVSEEILRIAALAGVAPGQVRHQLLVIPDTTLTTAGVVALTDLLSVTIEQSRCLLITRMDFQTWAEDASGPVLDKKKDGFFYEDFGLFVQLAGEQLNKVGADPRFFCGEVFYVFGSGQLKITTRVPADAGARKLHIAARINSFQLPNTACERLATMATIKGN